MRSPFNTEIESVFIGDSGSGGVEGLVPAPAAGDAEAGKVLGAGGGWVDNGGGGGGAVDSVFGRTENVVAVSGDYNASQVTNTPFVNSAERHESVNSQTYLDANSPFVQEFFGTNFQIAKLPDATTLLNGRAFLFINNSTGNLDIRTVNNDDITVIPSGARQIYQLSDNSTSSGVWNVSTYAPSNVAWGSNSLILPFLTPLKYLATGSDNRIVSVDAPTSGLTWNTVTDETQQISQNNGYIARSSTSVDFTLPTTADVGSSFEILYLSPQVGQLLQNAGQTIIAGEFQTATGTAGRIEGISNGESLVIRCTSADTEFMVIAPVGNFNVVES